MNLSHVAQEAGVSISTVSRVVNGFGWVKPETVQKVEAAMRTLKFDPSTLRRGPSGGVRASAANGNAHGRAAKVTEDVGLLLLGESRDLLQNPLFASVLSGVSEAVRRHGRSLVIEEESDPVRLGRLFRGRRVCGAVAIAKGGREDLLDPVRRQLPVVWAMGEAPAVSPVDHVGPDNLAVGALAHQYLLARGCEHVAFLTTAPRLTVMRLRAAGFQQAAIRAGRPAPTFVCTTNPLEAEAFGARVVAADSWDAVVDRFVETSPRPTGLFVPSDIQLGHIHRRLVARGVVPERDVFLIGCNNEQRLLGTMHPHPATIDLLPTEVGAMAAERLFHRIAHPDAPPTALQVTPRLVRAESNNDDDDDAPAGTRAAEPATTHSSTD